MSSGLNKVRKIIDSQRNFDGNMSEFVVSTVPADGLAPLGARPSAGTVMTNIRSYIYTYTYIYGTGIWRIKTSKKNTEM